jgi:hypothetical protein
MMSNGKYFRLGAGHGLKKQMITRVARNTLE